jgi:hypothetical protein
VSPAYAFRGTWTVPAPVERVQPVLLDLEHYPEWWPQVRAVAKITDDDARVLCRSTLPYTLDLYLHAERREPRLLETSLAGDLEGVVRWRLADERHGTRMHFEQDVRVAGRRLLNAASYAARPLLRWNHDRMMSGCIAGLRQRLAISVPENYG